MSNLQSKIEELTKVVGDLLSSQQAETQKVTCQTEEESKENDNKFQAMETRLTNVESCAIHAEKEIEHKNIRNELPEKMVPNDPPKFNGTGNPLAHIRAFKEHMSINGFKREHWHILFPLSLETAPQNWFYSMDRERISTFEKIILEFSLQYHDNTDTQASKGTFGSPSQEDNESFTEYFCRWTDFIIQLPNQPHESEFVTRFINNLRPDYRARMKSNKIDNLRQLVMTGTKVENDLKRQESSLWTPEHAARSKETNINTGQDTLSGSVKNTPMKMNRKRDFTPIPITYTEAFKRLNYQNGLQPIGPTQDPPIKPTGWDANAYCLYHRGKGHDTEECFRLKYKIQGWIDSGKIPKPKTTN